MLKNNLEIILVTYNRKEHLQNTFNQIFADDSPVKNLQITVLDNQSTDGTSDFIADYVKKFPNVKHIINNRNIGGNPNIARAFEIASKKYLWILCDDDNYDFSNFSVIEAKLASNDYDAIFTLECKNDLSDIFYQSTFVPACIYNTEKLTGSVIENMFCNIPNLFPHLAIMAKIINDNGKIATLKPEEGQVLIRGRANDAQQCSGKCYLRNIGDADLNSNRKNMFWFVGYINSLALINNKTKRNYILTHTEHHFKNFSALMTHKLWLNMSQYNFYSKNFLDILLGLNLYQKIFLFIPCFLKALIKYLSSDKKQTPDSVQLWQEYILEHKVLLKLDRKLKRYKNKKKLLYGTGMVTQALMKENPSFLENFDAISDQKIEKLQKCENPHLYEVPPSEIKNFDADVIFVAVYSYDRIKRSLQNSGVKCKIEKIL